MKSTLGAPEDMVENLESLEPNVLADGSNINPHKLDNLECKPEE